MLVYVRAIPTITKNYDRPSWHLLYVARNTINCVVCVIPSRIFVARSNDYTWPHVTCRTKGVMGIREEEICMHIHNGLRNSVQKQSLFLPGLLIRDKLFFSRFTVHWSCPDDKARLPLAGRDDSTLIVRSNERFFRFKQSPRSLGGVILANGAETFTRTSTPGNTAKSDAQAA